MDYIICTNLNTQFTKRFISVSACSEYFRKTLGYMASEKTMIREIENKIESGEALKGWVFDYE